jgi:hypothetical protein
MRALARRTFIQFTDNTDPVNGVCENVAAGTTFADAARLLSGMIFLNVWPSDAYARGTRIYLNPRAAHQITRGTARLFAHINPHMEIDDFVHDDY